MKASRLAAVAAVLLALTCGTPKDASALVVTFGATSGPSTSEFGPWVEDGMTMIPIATTPASSAGPPHWDHERGDAGGISLGASDADNNAVIHRGNAGEKVQFIFAGGNFDLLSIDLEVFLLEAPGLFVTFTSSSGTVATTSLAGTFDFTAFPGWSNISSFTMEVPLGNYTCDGGPEDCSNVSFDNVVFREPVFDGGRVPEPTTLTLLACGLVGIHLLRRRARL